MLTAKEIKALRNSAGFTQQQMSEMFGYSSVRSWQRKEESGNTSRSLSFAEEQYFLLLTDAHASKRIIDK